MWEARSTMRYCKGHLQEHQGVQRDCEGMPVHDSGQKIWPAALSLGGEPPDRHSCFRLLTAACYKHQQPMKAGPVCTLKYEEIFKKSKSPVAYLSRFWNEEW